MHDNPDSAGTPRYALETMLGMAFFQKVALGAQTKGFAVPDLCSPASNKVDLVLFHFCHSGMPRPHQLDVLVDLLRFDGVENDRVDIFTSRQDLREGSLDFLVHLSSFWRAVD